MFFDKAYLDLNECKNNGGHIDKKHIEKHKKDVLRLTAMLAPNDVFIVPDSLKVDIADFCKYVYNNIPNADFFKSIGLPKITGEQLVSQLKMNFLIE